MEKTLSGKRRVQKDLAARVADALRTSRLADVVLITDDGQERIQAHQVRFLFSKEFHAILDVLLFSSSSASSVAARSCAPSS